MYLGSHRAFLDNVGWVKPGAILDLDFVLGRYFWKDRLQDLRSIPFTGGDNGTFVDSGKLLRANVPNVPRRSYDIATGAPLGLSTEIPRTNICLWSDDLTQAGSWTLSNMTAAKTATGPDGVANSASTLTATAGNATVLQSITSGSASRITSCYIKRRTGTGTINITQDNGTTWTAVTVTSEWTRVVSVAATAANPIVGIRIVTSGDAVDVFGFQNETSAQTAAVSSLARTTTASVTKTEDAMILPCASFGLVSYTGISALTEWAPVGTAHSYQFELNTSAGGTANAFSFGLNNGQHQFVVRSANSIVVNQTGGSVTANVFGKAAGAHALDNSRHAFNGTLQNTDDTVCALTVLTGGSLWIGRRSVTPSADNHSYLKRLTIWNKRLPNETLAAMTA